MRTHPRLWRALSQRALPWRAEQVRPPRREAERERLERRIRHLRGCLYNRGEQWAAFALRRVERQLNTWLRR